MAPQIDYQPDHLARKGGKKGRKRFERRRKSAEKQKAMEGTEKDPNKPGLLIDIATSSPLENATVQKHQVTAADALDAWTSMNTNPAAANDLNNWWAQNGTAYGWAALSSSNATLNGANNTGARNGAAARWDSWDIPDASSDDAKSWGSLLVTPTGGGVWNSSSATSVSSSSCGDQNGIAAVGKTKGNQSPNRTAGSTWGNKLKAAAQTTSNAWAKSTGPWTTAQNLFPQVRMKDSQEPKEGKEVNHSKDWVDDGDACWMPWTESRPDGTRFAPETPEAREKRMIKARVDEELKDWPLMADPLEMKTIAPFLGSGKPWSMPKDPKNANCLLFTKFLSNEVVSRLFFEELFKDPITVGVFEGTCQLAKSTVELAVSHWDMTNAYFHDCELPVKSREELMNDPNAKQGRVGSIVIVSPVRKPGGPISYARQAQNLHTMCQAMHNKCDNIRNIQFHRVPLLTIHVLALLIPMMRNLKFLGIYNCPLIHIGDLPNLLSLLTVDRPKGCENQVKLDFYPMYHRGPPDSFGKYFTGSYATTWDNSGIPTDVAIWSIVAPMMTRAKKQGFDLVAKGTAFRQWLEKSPCLEVAATIKVLHDSKSTPEKKAAWMDYRRFQGSVTQLKLTADKPGESKWATDLRRCPTCKLDKMTISYYWGDVRAHRWFGDNPPECWGCQLDWHLRNEKDHYKVEKRKIIIRWLKLPRPSGGFQPGESKFNDVDLAKALTDFESNKVLERAQLLDELRASHIADAAAGRQEYDHELEERQKPIPLTAQNQKNVTFYRSPTVNRIDMNNDGWNWAPLNRYDGHGLAWR